MNIEVGNRIKEARIRKGMTQVQLAKALNVSNGTIGNYESGIAFPKPQILCSIMKVLECDANYMYQDFITVAPDELINSAEKEHMRKYRQLNDDGKHMVDSVLDLEYARLSASNASNGMNAHGEEVLTKALFCNEDVRSQKAQD